jgi:hypothetical protein|tara:strand:- start:5797 stop:7857 length:2061 start_codon:yes stop_codon:yes gene_type:complete
VTKDCIEHREIDWDISCLKPLLSADFFRLVVKEGNDLVSGKAQSTARYYVDALKDFSGFLATSPKDTQISSDLKLGIAPQHSRTDWVYFLYRFSRYLKEINTLGQARKRSQCFNEWLKRMASRGICPSGLRMPKVDKVRSAPPQTVLHTLSEEQFEQVEALYSSENFSGEAELVAEAKLVCTNVLAEYSDADITGKNLSDLIQATLEKRLSDLYNGAWEVYQAALERRAEGIRLIQVGAEFAPIIDDWLMFPDSFKSKKNKPILARARALSDEQFWAGLLAWYMNYHSLRGIHAVEGHSPQQVVTRLRNEIKDYRKGLRGKYSANEFIELMGASRDLMVSGFLLMMFETCANPGDLGDIKIYDKTQVFDNLAVIDWTKSRARKVLSKWDSSAESRESVTQIFNQILVATKYYRNHAHALDQDRLFLHVYAHSSNAKHRTIAKDYVAGQATYKSFFAHNIESLINRLTDGRWKIRAKGVRASLILLKTLKEGVSAAREMAQHSEGRTTKGYVASFPFKQKLESHMREYIEWLEALVTIKLDDVAAKLGLNEEEYKRVKDDVLSSQFGSVHCSDPKSGFQPGSLAGVPCNQVMMCMSCEKRRNIFIASENNVANLIQWREALLEAFENRIIDDSNINWVLWRIYVDTMYDRLSNQLKHKALLLDVERSLAEQTENPYRNVFFRSTEST